MKTVKISVFAIGVALSVTPFFNSARAQSTTDSAAILLELQALRSEIGDLRDMVERQQFELKRLKQKNAEQQPTISQQPSRGAYSQGRADGGQLDPSQAYPQQGYPQQGYRDDHNAQPSANVPGFEGASSNSVDPRYNSPAGAAYNDRGAVDARGAADQSRTPDLPQQYADQANGYIDRSNSQADVPYSEHQGALANGVQVVDREVDRQPSSVNLGRNAPEIVERGIDGSQAAPNTAPALSSDANTAVDYNNRGSQPLLQDPRPAIGQNGLPSSSSSPQAAGRPVISVPNGSAVSNPVINENSVIDANGPLTDPTTNAPANQTQVNAAQPVAKFTEDQYYDRGFAFLKQSKYDEAVNVFKQQIVDHPQGDLADDAHYWIAEAMFINRKPSEARPHLREIIDNYPQSARLPDAMLKSAYIEQDLGNLIEARILLQEIVARHPSSNAAIAAKNRLENLKSVN